MSQDVKDLIGHSLAGIFIVIAILIALWGVGWVCSGIGHWWKDATYTSPAQKAEMNAADQKEADDWAKDPTNPSNVAKACVADGGVPIISAWTGRVTHCKYKGES